MIREGEAEGAGNFAQGGVSGSGGSCSGKFQGDGAVENGNRAPRLEGAPREAQSLDPGAGSQSGGEVREAGGLDLLPLLRGEGSLSLLQLVGPQTSLLHAWLQGKEAGSETWDELEWGAKSLPDNPREYLWGRRCQMHTCSLRGANSAGGFTEARLFLQL